MILVTVAVASCVDHDPISPSANVLIVQSVLDLGATNQYVLVQRTNGLRASATFVSGATVTLRLPDGRAITAQEVRDTSINLATGQKQISLTYQFPLGRLGLALQPGGRYNLRVELPDGRVVTGATTVPNALPAPDAATTQPFNLSRDTVRFAWRAVPAARGYALSITSNARTHTVLSDTTIDFTTETFRSADVGVFQTETTQHLVLSAVDTNFYDYFRSRTDEFTGAGLISHLQGAVGVFGSIVELDARTVRFQ